MAALALPALARRVSAQGKYPDRLHPATLAPAEYVAFLKLDSLT